jgi:hypothetical protein
MEDGRNVGRRRSERREEGDATQWEAVVTGLRTCASVRHQLGWFTISWFSIHSLSSSIPLVETITGSSGREALSTGHSQQVKVQLLCDRIKSPI